MNPAGEPNGTSGARTVRPRTRPAVGLPSSRDDRRGWGLLSALLHILLIALLIGPVASHEGIVLERDLGAGGAGPAGGGGGGHRGTGGSQEHVAYVQAAPPPVATAAVPPPVVPPPIIQPTPPPVIPPPPAAKPVEVIPDAKVEVKQDVPKVEVAAAVPGVGGGTGRDGSAGNGPGTGGGVGSGSGTGRGSGNGPGTGGGAQTNFAPYPTDVFIPPLPMPDKVRGFHLVAEFDVDETGKVVSWKFTPTRDGGYNRRLADVLKNFKFRPGTKPDGTPIRMTAQIIYDF